MKALHVGSGLLFVTLATFFFLSSNALSENSTTPSSIPPPPHTPSFDTNHPLAKAQKYLKQAREHYEKNDLEAVREDLKAASQSLHSAETSNDSKTSDEATKLNKEVQLLQEKIKNPSVQHEGAIARLWHRSSALVGREINQLAKSWNETSTANKTLKYLIDARLHFEYAEHDLFFSQDSEKANQEISKTLGYIDEAQQVAIPRVREKLASIKQDIEQLPNMPGSSATEQSIIDALEEASVSIRKAHNNANPDIQSRVQSIEEEISRLKNDIIMLEKRQKYNLIMDRLQQLDALL